jgi:hypothetical protein
MFYNFYACWQKLLRTTMSFVTSVHPNWTTGSPLDRIEKKIYLRNFRKSVEKNKLSLQSDRKDYFTWRRVWWYLAHSSSNEKCLIKKFLDKLKTRILLSITFFVSENRAVYEIMWKNMAGTNRLIRWQYGACASLYG